MSESSFHIRRASVHDAEAIARVLDVVVGERIHSAIERAWTAAEQRTYLASLSTPAQAFYKHLGFVECGRLRAQVTVDGREDDEIVLEFFLNE